MKLSGTWRLNNTTHKTQTRQYNPDNTIQAIQSRQYNPGNTIQTIQSRQKYYIQ